MNSTARFIMMSHLSDIQESASPLQLRFVKFLMAKFANTSLEINPDFEWSNFLAIEKSGNKTDHEPGEFLKNDVHETLTLLLNMVGRLDKMSISSHPGVTKSSVITALVNFAKFLLLQYPILTTIIDQRAEWKRYQDQMLKSRMLTFAELALMYNSSLVLTEDSKQLNA